MKNVFFILLLGFCIVGPALANETRDWSGDEIRGIHYAVPRNALLPDRWQAELQHTDDCQAPCTVEFDDRMSTVYLRYKWMQLNPEQGVYDFSDLGETLDLIMAADKRISLIVMAGKYTPAWVFENGAKHVDNEAVGSGEFSQDHIPATWDPVFLEAHGAMIEALAAFFRQYPERYEALALVKNGALTIYSGETRMMALGNFIEKSERNGDVEDEAMRKTLCQNWARIGYSEDKALLAARTTNAQIAKAFPDQYLGLAFVAGSNRFPTVKDGKCAYPKKNSTLNKIVKEMVKIYGGRVVVNETTLAEGGVGQPQIMSWARTHGGRIAFQVNARRVGCRNRKAPCEEADFLGAAQEGIAAGAVFLEVHDGNIHRYRELLPNLNMTLIGN
jgi:hypothetical protein